MAVVGKKRKRGTTYYVVTWFQKKAWPERAGTDEREAQRLDARRKREVKAGTYQPPAMVRASTVIKYAEQWGPGRTNTTAQDDRTNVARFTGLPEFGNLHLDECRPRHVIAALKKLRGTISEKTLQNAYGALRTMFRDVVIDDLIKSSPCTIPRNFFDGSEAEEREAYERHEAALLVRHNAVDAPIRALNALGLLGGLREGESCGRRWRDLDTKPEPLAALDVKTQYEGRSLKTRRPRVVPVHPELLDLLEEWGRVGFVELMGRPPAPDDFIVPRIAKRGRVGHWTKSTYSKAFVKACTAAGVRYRTLHSTRHTMITLAKRGGARKDDLRVVTHNPKGDIIDRYTHLDWLPLCNAVLAIGSLFSARPSPRLLGNSPQETWGNDGGSGVPMLTESHESANQGRTKNPARAHDPQHETSLAVGPRKSPRQSGYVGNGALPRSANQLRIERLELIAGVDSALAAPGLAVCRGLDMALAGDVDGALAILRKEALRGA